MKKLFSGIVLFLIVWMFLSCASKPNIPTSSNPFRPLSGFPNSNVIAPVQTNFALNGVNQSQVALVNEAAYSALLETARKEHSGNIDIADISWVLLRASGWATFHYSATGRVIVIDTGSRTSSNAGVEGALARAATDVSSSFNANSRIAIVYITAQDRSTTDYITGELEHILRGKGFVIIDRAELDRIRTEQQFGVSGEVDDTTAVRMGYIAGASVVITGRVDGEGDLRRLRLRALDTTSAQVVGTASERF